jgi:hypothetical protein
MSPEQILMFVGVWPATVWLLVEAGRLVREAMKGIE